tara:strand:+ start:245 stop:670 length:426 start_codon:yes stop_codon:yes gene_type:complete
MRATISFDADVNKVKKIMRSLVLEEMNSLSEATTCLAEATPENLAKSITDSLEHIQGVLEQLHQYRDMVNSFDRARFETVLPQNVNTPAFNINPDTSATVTSLRDVQAAVAAMNHFDGFVDKINQQEAEQEDGEQDEPQEG